MPGLTLTPAQKKRLFGLEAAECDVCLETLVSEGFLVRTRKGIYRIATGPRRAARADV